MNFRQLSLLPQNIPEIFHAAPRPSVNFCQLSVHLRNLPSTFCASVEILCPNSVSFSCVRGLFEKVQYGCWIFCQHQLTFRAVAGLSVSFLCIRGTFCQLSIRSRDYLFTFRVSARHSVNFRQLSVRPRDPLSTSMHLWDLLATSVNSSCILGTFCQYLCIHGTFRKCFVQPLDLPSTLVNFPCDRETFC